MRYVLASHAHEDHLDHKTWKKLGQAFSASTAMLHPDFVMGDRLLTLGGEALWLVKGAKHSKSDVVTVFRGVAMTGDIELGQLESVNDEVPDCVKRGSMKWLAGFPNRSGYHVHSIVSAHLNDVREGVRWPDLFRVPEDADALC